MELFLLGAERANCLARVRTRSEAPCRARTGGKPGVRPPPIKKGQKSSIKNGAFFIVGGASHPGSPKMQHLWGGAAWLPWRTRVLRRCFCFAKTAGDRRPGCTPQGRGRTNREKRFAVRASRTWRSARSRDRVVGER